MSALASACATRAPTTRPNNTASAARYLMPDGIPQIPRRAGVKIDERAERVKSLRSSGCDHELDAPVLAPAIGGAVVRDRDLLAVTFRNHALGRDLALDEVVAH